MEVAVVFELLCCDVSPCFCFLLDSCVELRRASISALAELARFCAATDPGSLYPEHSSLFCLHVSHAGRSPEQAVFLFRHVKHAAPILRLFGCGAFCVIKRSFLGCDPPCCAFSCASPFPLMVLISFGPYVAWIMRHRVPLTRIVQRHAGSFSTAVSADRVASRAIDIQVLGLGGQATAR